MSDAGVSVFLWLTDFFTVVLSVFLFPFKKVFKRGIYLFISILIYTNNIKRQTLFICLFIMSNLPNYQSDYDFFFYVILNILSELT